MKKVDNVKKVSSKQVKTKKEETQVSKPKRQGSLALYLILFILFFAVCLFFASKTIERKKMNPVTYSQSGTIDYKVYLNPNDFYTEKYLDMHKSYVASLINYIDINFNYLFKISENTNMDFDYKIIGELILENSKGTGRYLEKKYVLQDNKKKELKDNNLLNIIESVKIDYNYYNQLANSFKATYGVDINGYLNVYLEVSPKTADNLNYIIDESNKTLLRIPLSEKAIEINLDATNQNLYKQIIPKDEIKFTLLYLILEIVFLIPTCIFLVKLIKKILILLDIYTPYDRYVRKILKNYDRLIVETDSKIKKQGCNIIEVKNFNELLDAHDNLNLPILYLNTVLHEEGVFYISNNSDVYVFNVKNEDLKHKK